MIFRSQTNQGPSSGYLWIIRSVERCTTSLPQPVIEIKPHPRNKFSRGIRFSICYIHVTIKHCSHFDTQIWVKIKRGGKRAAEHNSLKSIVRNSLKYQILNEILWFIAYVHYHNFLLHFTYISFRHIEKIKARKSKDRKTQLRIICQKNTTCLMKQKHEESS